MAPAFGNARTGTWNMMRPNVSPSSTLIGADSTNETNQASTTITSPSIWIMHMIAP